MYPFEGMLRVRKHNPRAFSSVGIVVRFRFFFRERVLTMRDSYRTTSSAASDAASARFISVYCDASFILTYVFIFLSLYSVSDRILKFFIKQRNSKQNRASSQPLTVFNLSFILTHRRNNEPLIEQKRHITNQKRRCL